MAPIPKTTGPDNLNATMHDLDRLLKRLDRAVLSEDEADEQLRHSVYQRRKTGAVSITDDKDARRHYI